MKADECEVVVPQMRDAVEAPVHHLLHRRDRIQHPDADETGINPPARLKRDEPRVHQQCHAKHDPDGSLGGLNCPTHDETILKLDESCNPKYGIGPAQEGSNLRFRISDLRCRIRPISKFLPALSPQLIAIFLNKSKSLSIFPVPSTTHDSGFSAKVTGRPVSSRIRLSRFLISAPPPARTIPRSAISADNSGGVRSRTTRIELMMILMHSSRASRISSSETMTLLGTPSIRSRPLISIVRGWSNGWADPISILTCSAVRSPIRRLYFLLMYWVIASSISLPATLSERL